RMTGQPIDSTPIHLFWLERGRADVPWGSQTVTDGEGWALYCDVPPEQQLYVSLLLPDLRPGPLQARCALVKNELAARTIVATRPRMPAARPYPDTLMKLPECRSIEPRSPRH